MRAGQPTLGTRPKVACIESVREARFSRRGDEIMASTKVATPSLQRFLDAFNAHDVDAIMSFFTEDCVFDTPRGPAPGGLRLVGRQQVRGGIQARFDGIPDIHYGDDRHWICGDRGVSEWTIRGTQTTGEPIEVRGCDLFEFTDGKISRKDSFWKIVD